jgi:YVTN family beta-propeller protein
MRRTNTNDRSLSDLTVLSPSPWHSRTIELLHAEFGETKRGLLVVLCANLLFGVAPLGAAIVCDPCVWLTNQRSNSISVMDSATNAVIANVPAGQNPQWLAWLICYAVDMG